MTDIPDMPAKTLEALKQSIAKWEQISAGTGIDYGQDNCALCQLFLPRCCAGCPVFSATHLMECYDTPYREWTQLREPDVRFLPPVGPDQVGGRQAMTENAQVLARMELAFLRSLLPTESTPEGESLANRSV